MRTSATLPPPTPGDGGSIAVKTATYPKLYRFVDTDYVRASASPSDEQEPSFNPLLRTRAKGGRFDAARRVAANWLHDPYEYLYGAVTLKGAFYESFGTTVERANTLKAKPSLDGTKWLEIFRTASAVTSVDLRDHWEGRSVPAQVNTSADYPSCREWASWIRIKEKAVQALEYLPPHSITAYCVVFFRDHGSATEVRGSSRGRLRVFKAYRITDRFVQGWMRGAGVGEVTFVMS